MSSSIGSIIHTAHEGRRNHVHLNCFKVLEFTIYGLHVGDSVALHPALKKLQLSPESLHQAVHAM